MCAVEYSHIHVLIFYRFSCKCHSLVEALEASENRLMPDICFTEICHRSDVCKAPTEREFVDCLQSLNPVMKQVYQTFEAQSSKWITYHIESVQSVITQKLSILVHPDDTI